MNYKIKMGEIKFLFFCDAHWSGRYYNFKLKNPFNVPFICLKSFNMMNLVCHFILHFIFRTFF